MNVARNKALGEQPWAIIEPVGKSSIPDDAVFEGGFHWWVVGTTPEDLKVMQAGGPGGHCEVHNSEFPDEIWDRVRAIDPNR